MKRVGGSEYWLYACAASISNQMFHISDMLYYAVVYTERGVRVASQS